VLACDGALTVSVAPVRALPAPADPFYASTLDPAAAAAVTPPALVLRLDAQPTPGGLYTRTKTTRRAHYDAARARRGVGAGPEADVLLFDALGRVSETSVRNVALWRRGHWRTPGEATGCLPGVARRWLVENGRVVVEDGEGELTVAGLVDGEVALVFNAVEGCRLAVVRLYDEV
jgi:4-amino-4-deoxychorismate lyase